LPNTRAQQRTIIYTKETNQRKGTCPMKYNLKMVEEVD